MPGGVEFGAHLQMMQFHPMVAQQMMAAQQQQQQQRQAAWMVPHVRLSTAASVTRHNGLSSLFYHALARLLYIHSFNDPVSSCIARLRLQAMQGGGQVVQPPIGPPPPGGPPIGGPPPGGPPIGGPPPGPPPDDPPPLPEGEGPPIPPKEDPPGGPPAGAPLPPQNFFPDEPVPSPRDKDVRRARRPMHNMWLSVGDDRRRRSSR